MRFEKGLDAVLILALSIVITSPIGSAIQSSNFVFSNGGTIGLSLVYTARSGSARDIQDAVNIAAAQGITKVMIPEGTFDFVRVGESWMTVNVPDGMSIFGAPTERDSDGQVTQWATILRMPFEAPAGSMFFGFSGTTGTRISDIQMVGYREINPDSTKQYNGIGISNAINFRIDHSYFRNIAGNGIPVSRSNGVVDHNKFINNPAHVTAAIASCTVGYGVAVYGGGTATPWEPNIQDVLGHYTSRSVFIEDNYFEGWRHVVASNDHAHYVYRYNAERKNGYGTVDAHGREGTGAGEGTRAIEVYSNDFGDPVWGGDTKMGVQIRGGGGVIFNNIVDGYGTYPTGVYSAFVCMVQYTPDIYPDQQIKDVYIWNNTLTPSDADLYDTAYGGLGNNNNPPQFSLNAPSQAVDGFTYTPYQYPHPLVTD